MSKDQCGLCLYYYAERGDYGFCLLKRKELSGYGLESCFEPRFISVVDWGDRQERSDSVHGVPQAIKLSDDAKDAQQSF